jgi:hypothetical protein
MALSVLPPDLDSPRVAADLAVLDQGALNIGLEVDVPVLAAVRALNGEFIIHEVGCYAGASSSSSSFFFFFWNSHARPMLRM